MSHYNERAKFIEETGILFEEMGLTRMSGRILGYLMISDKEEVSFDEMTKVLQASKSSISTNLKALTQIEFIKPVSKPGDRKTYYMLTPDMDWSGLFEKRLSTIRQLTNLFEKGLELRVNKKDTPAEWLASAKEFHEWLNQEFPEMLKRRKEKETES